MSTDDWGMSAEDHEIEQDLHLRLLGLQIRSDTALLRCLRERQFLRATVLGQMVTLLVMAIALFLAIQGK